MEISLLATACQFVKDYWPHISLGSIAIPAITRLFLRTSDVQNHLQAKLVSTSPTKNYCRRLLRGQHTAIEWLMFSRRCLI